jgi:hypothetical protein
LGCLFISGIYILSTGRGMVRKQASGHLVNAHPLSRGLLQRGLL